MEDIILPALFQRLEETWFLPPDDAAQLLHRILTVLQTPRQEEKQHE